jgi:hypothetical protein
MEHGGYYKIFLRNAYDSKLYRGLHLLKKDKVNSHEKSLESKKLVRILKEVSIKFLKGLSEVLKNIRCLFVSLIKLVRNLQKDIRSS